MISVINTTNDGIKRNNDSVLKYLKIINDNSKVKDIIDDFLIKRFKAYQQDCKGYDDYKRNVYLRSVFSDFKKLTSDIRNNYDISTSACHAYFNMDCNLFSKISFYTGFLGEDIKFVFSNEEYHYPIKIDGHSMDKIYSKGGEETGLFFVLNKDLFPPSAQKAIVKAQGEHEKMAFNTLPDLFKAKIFVNKFDNTFKASSFKPVLKKFGDIREGKERFDTFYNLYRALRAKYYDKSVENIKLDNFLDSIAVRALHHATHVFNNVCSESSYFQYLEKFAEDRDFCKAFAKATFSRKSDFQLPMAMSFLVEGEEKSQMDSLVAKQLISQTSNNYVKFGNLPTDLQEAYFIESKKQFLDDHKNLSDLLAKLDRLPFCEN